MYNGIKLYFFKGVIILRILVISDSHGNKFNFWDAVENEPTAEIVLFLGDGIRDFEDIEASFGDKKVFFAVSGNCDLGFSDYPHKIIRTFEGYKFYITHGFTENVKYGMGVLKECAFDANCDVAVFGHTHTPIAINNSDLHILNPGSIREGSYGVFDITQGGIICINKNLVSY